MAERLDEMAVPLRGARPERGFAALEVRRVPVRAVLVDRRFELADLLGSRLDLPVDRAVDVDPAEQVVVGMGREDQDRPSLPLFDAVLVGLFVVLAIGYLA